MWWIPALVTLSAASQTVCLQPLGRYDQGLLAFAARGVTYVYGAPTETLPPVPMPASAYYAPRQRHRADTLLTELVRLRPERCRWIMGFTSQDISTEKPPYTDWGIFGLATIGGPSGVISTFRLGARHADRRAIAQRTIKVLNHELGHALGRDHCPNLGCLMEDAAGTIGTVDGEHGLFCELCGTFLDQQLDKPLRRTPIDWSELLRP